MCVDIYIPKLKSYLDYCNNEQKEVVAMRPDRCIHEHSKLGLFHPKQNKNKIKHVCNLNYTLFFLHMHMHVIPYRFFFTRMRKSLSPTTHPLILQTSIFFTRIYLSEPTFLFQTADDRRSTRWPCTPPRNPVVSTGVEIHWQL
jgi:hypothetical protein